jgi:hypothetical protein
MSLRMDPSIASALWGMIQDSAKIDAPNFSLKEYNLMSSVYKL